MLFRFLTRASSFTLLAGVAAAQSTLFSTSYGYPAVDGPSDIALADIDNDGTPDVLVSSYLTHNVAVYLGTGAGTLNPLPPLNVGGNQRALVVAHMNGDANLDLVTANAEDHTVSLLLGNGAGGFGAPAISSTGSFPVAIDAGDLDLDGDLDLVIGDQSLNGLFVRLGNGNGGLGAASFHPTGFTSERIQLADMNADGMLDCVSAGGTENVVVSLGDGTGNLVAGNPVVSPTITDLAVGDVSGDGLPDVVLASQYDRVDVFLSVGGGMFAAPKTYQLGTGVDHPTAVVIADASADGRPDLIVCAATSKTMTVLVGVGGGNFSFFGHTSPIAEAAFDAVAADFNGDGFDDVVTAHQLNDSIRVHMCDGVGAWEEYCSAKFNSLGCASIMYAIGSPSISNPQPFWVYVYNVYNAKSGIFIYKVNGSQQALPFGGGTLCIGPSAIRRTPAKNSGGDSETPPPNCTGKYVIDFNAFAQGLAGGTPDPALLVLGNHYQLQCWSRDPGFPAPNNIGLSAALDVTPWL